MEDLRLSGRVVPECWNPLPSEIILLFAPCRCECCDPAKEFARLAIERGDTETIGHKPQKWTEKERTGRPHTRAETAYRQWKASTAKYQKPRKSIVERDREAKALHSRQNLRKTEFDLYWEKFCAIPGNHGDYQDEGHSGRGWLLDVKNGRTLSSDGVNSPFFRHISNSEQLPLDDICVCCRFPLRQTDDRDEEDATEGQASDAVVVLGPAVMLPCGHMLHYRCCYNWFASQHGKTNCVICRRQFKVILKNGFDDLVYKWIDEEERMCQIDGYILPSPKVLENYNFKFFQKKDDWCYSTHGTAFGINLT
jgi:hypothetical protein